MSKRAIRRHHRERLKKQRATYYSYGPKTSSGPMNEVFLGKVVRTAKLCSCWMCNRPTDRFGISFKDKRLQARMRAVEKEMYDE